MLPSSPYAPAGPSAPRRRYSWRAWRIPLIAGAVCLALLVAGFVLLLPYLARPLDGGPGTARPGPLAEGIEGRVEAGRRALFQGRPHLARIELNAAIALRAAGTAKLPPARNRELNQLHRQADLVARLSPFSVEEIIQRARLVPNAEEWQQHFADHAGRTVIFDGILRRDGEGRPTLGAVLDPVDGAEPVRLALEDVELIRELPAEEERWIFGVRLASVAREEGGNWVVRFVPDSGVLLTEIELVEQCLLVPADDKLRAAVERQQHWIEQRPTLPPAQP